MAGPNRPVFFTIRSAADLLNLPANEIEIRGHAAEAFISMVSGMLGPEKAKKALESASIIGRRVDHGVQPEAELISVFGRNWRTA